MELEEYKSDVEKNKKENKHYVSKYDDQVEFVDLNKKPKRNLEFYLKKFSVDFLYSYGFKVLFKLARSLDKSKSPYLSLDRILHIVFNFSNVKYGLFVVLIKIIFKIFRKFLRFIKLESVMEYKRLNFLFGLLTDLILIPIGKKDNLIFYTTMYYLFKSFLFFTRKHIYGLEDRKYSESKQFYYIGLSLGFIIISLIKSEYRKHLKI